MGMGRAPGSAWIMLPPDRMDADVVARRLGDSIRPVVWFVLYHGLNSSFVSSGILTKKAGDVCYEMGWPKTEKGPGLRNGPKCLNHAD
ncbi:hypothetical protein OsJ_03978 [Oryza sativa Japonica Group]|uniref:Uncharacterized protein n=3 Tax=Oryza TaxID=4527 RepID=A2ZZA7_ORYSJ|nr:hypothetical protein OsJ_03978 [Oryza sativa Japonica Group]